MRESTFFLSGMYFFFVIGTYESSSSLSSLIYLDGTSVQTKCNLHKGQLQVTYLGYLIFQTLSKLYTILA